MASQGQQWRDYFICKGTSAIPCLVRQLAPEVAGRAAASAASCTLAGLAAMPANQGDVLQAC